jgi:NADPH:quinone reductase
MTSAEEIAERAGRLFALLASGALTVTVDRRLDLGQAVEAHRLLESRATAGKLLLRIADDRG